MTTDSTPYSVDITQGSLISKLLRHGSVYFLSSAIAKFRRQSTVILGVSRDSLKTQENFKTKQSFPFDLIADPEEELCRTFDVIKMKNMYGKQVRGIERSTFLIDAEGVLRQEWRKVKVKGHVDEVLEAVKAIKKS